MNDRATGLVIERPAGRSNAINGFATLVRTHRAQVELMLAVTVYFGFACLLTWPLITQITHSVYAVPGDPYGAIAMYRELVSHHVNPFLPSTLHQIAAPEGLPVPWPRNLASAPSILTLYLLTTFFGAVPALSLYTLAGYVLTGTVTFLFARRITRNTWAALIAGWAFAFYPFASINGLGHNDNVQGWVLMLAVWRMVELMWYPSRRNGLLAGMAVVLAMWWSPYFILFGGVAYVSVTAVTMLLSWRKHGLRATFVPQLIVALLVALFLVYLGVLSTVGAEIGARTNEVGVLYTYAARPLEYILPDVRSLLFGSDTRHYIETHQHSSGSMEDTLYIGGTIILLALVAVAALFLRKLKTRVSGVVLVLLVLVVVSVATSMQPEMSIMGIMVPFPSYFISKITTTWRVYSRFVIVVMLASTLLAAIGLDVLTRTRTLTVKIAIMCLVTIAVPLDLWYHQPHGVAKLSTPPTIYKILARQPAGLVAEYPLPPSGGNLYNDIYYRNVYNMPIITGYPEHSIQVLRALSLSDLAYPLTAQRLAALGVRYVILDASPESWGWPAAGRPGAGFHLIAHESYANLYAVTARPTGPALATPGPGFVVTAVEATSTAWLQQSKGTIALAGNCTHCKGTLSMVLGSEEPYPQAAIFDSHGNLLAQGPISVSTLIKIPLDFSKQTTVTLKATRAPGALGAEEGSGITIRVTNLEFTATNGGGASNSNSNSNSNGNGNGNGQAHRHGER